MKAIEPPNMMREILDFHPLVRLLFDCSSESNQLPNFEIFRLIFGPHFGNHLVVAHKGLVIQDRRVMVNMIVIRVEGTWNI